MGTTDNFLVEGDPGVCMRLGDIALGGGSGGTRIFDTSQADTSSTNVGGIFDFIAYGLPVAGQSYRVVLPQTSPIPINAIYRKQDSNDDWQDFAQTADDQLWSTAGEAGYCPPPGDPHWEPGLLAGYWCVQLVITDGGPNDADGLVNSTIVDPGGVAVVIDNNSQPVAQDDTAEIRLNTLVTIDVLENDTDPDGDSLQISSANGVFGTVTIVDNQLDYQPAASFFGIDTIVYGISDGQGGSASATLLVTVLPNENPVAVDDVASTVSGQTVVIDVLHNDTDAENDALSVIWAVADNGTVTINEDNSLSYVSHNDFTGIEILHYRIRDALGAEASGQIQVTVAVASVTVSIKTSGGGTVFWLLLFSLSLLAYRYIYKIKMLKDNC